MTTTMTKEKTRVCRVCNEEKSIKLFERDRRVTDGITNRCRECKYRLDDRGSRLYRRLKSRSSEDGQPLEVTRKELQALFTAFDGKCIYCGVTEEETEHSHHVDHVIPVSKGGRHHRSNLVLACISCNSSKGNEPFFSFYVRKKDEVGDDNFGAVVYYLSLLNEQPIKETMIDFLIDYYNYEYKHLKDWVDEKGFEQIAKDTVESKLKTEAI